MNEYQTQEQEADFRKTYSTINHPLRIKIITLKSIWVPCLYDFHRLREGIWYYLKFSIGEQQSGPQVHTTYKTTKQRSHGYKFLAHKKEAREGDMLSPKLFTLAPEDVFKKMDQNYTIIILEIRTINWHLVRQP